MQYTHHNEHIRYYPATVRNHQFEINPLERLLLHSWYLNANWKSEMKPTAPFSNAMRMTGKTDRRWFAVKPAYQQGLKCGLCGDFR